MILPPAISLVVLSVMHERIKRVYRKLVVKLIELEIDGQKEEIFVLMLYFKKFPKLLGVFYVEFPVSIEVSRSGKELFRFYGF